MQTTRRTKDDKYGKVFDSRMSQNFHSDFWKSFALFLPFHVALACKQNPAIERLLMRENKDFNKKIGTDDNCHSLNIFLQVPSWLLNLLTPVQFSQLLLYSSNDNVENLSELIGIQQG